MKNTKKRSAYFICSLSYKYPKRKVITCTGKVYGKISLKISGKKGFGYDPIFIPKNYKKTYAELP